MLLAFAYVALSDLGAPLPASERLRTFIDRHDISVLRPRYERAEVVSAAAPQRRAISDALAANRTPPNWLKVSLKPGARLEVEVWSQSQALAGMFRTREAKREELLRKTAQFLIDSYDTTGDRPGWRGIREGADETFDGLTLQIYSLLLRARRGRRPRPRRDHAADTAPHQ